MSQRATNRSATAFAPAFTMTAEVCEASALQFRDQFGRTTIDQLGLEREDTVLDLGCGAGSATIAAAHQVGPLGRVIALDLDEDLVDQARWKCHTQCLRNVDFRVTDFESFRIAPGSFDAATCAFGIFFFPDMPRTLRKLWSALRPGGRLAITTWGECVLEPANSEFWRLVHAEDAAVEEDFHEFHRVADPTALCKLLTRSGIEPDKIIVENYAIPIQSAEDWWEIVQGTRYRQALRHFSPSVVDRIKRGCLDLLRKRRVRSLDTQVLYAVATKS